MIGEIPGAMFLFCVAHQLLTATVVSFMTDPGAAGGQGSSFSPAASGAKNDRFNTSDHKNLYAVDSFSSLPARGNGIKHPPTDSSPTLPIRPTPPPYPSSAPLLPIPPAIKPSSSSGPLFNLELPGMDLNPIEFSSSAPQLQSRPRHPIRRPAQRPPPPPPTGEVIDLLSSGDELPSVIIPAKRKPKEKEQIKAVERSPGNKKRKSQGTAELLDLSNIQVLDLSQPDVTPRSGLIPSKTPGRSRVPRIAVEARDEIVASCSSSPQAAKSIGGVPDTREEPVYFNSDFDDSLLGNWRSPVSAPKMKATATGNPALLVLSDSDDSDDLDMLLGTAAQKSTRTQKTTTNSVRPFSAKTLEILAKFKSVPDDDDSDNENPPSTEKRHPVIKRKTTTKKASAPTSRATSAPVPAAAASKRGGLSEEEKAHRAAEKAAEKAKKEEAARAKKEAKEAAAAEKRREQELASFNKLRTSKKDSSPEMIVDISTALARDDVGTRLVGLLKDLGSDPRPTWQLSGIERDWKVVKWRREVKAEYNPALSVFVPLPQKEIRNEKHILVHLTAKEFVELAYPEDADALLNLDAHVKIMKKLVRGPDVRVIYMIDGLVAYARKSKATKNNNFRAQVLSAMDGAPAPAARRAAPSARIIDEEMLEDALLKLQVKHSCLIQQTAGSIESAEWISILTGDISTIPYKTSRMVLDTSFCTDVGQVKTGVDTMDTWSKMLQEIHRVTPAVANGITDRYPDARSLIRAFETLGEGAVADVPLMATRNGAPSNRPVGMALSRRICTVFAGKDEDCLDV
ncbi:hypothetical protein BZA05DRAFT_411329 [Tricharina praecox]|uniref:uncharacterized protein n=1 Tax=Tricharina praecox TaxID=43433 RepID=UPI00221FDB72|nr:uncharacterized protein BZA05DRAFT_411329 [Tricharina praecox]KAI5843164.1 hypothetical protein BZA05DRAFT_411329 [Tricharina praecox]